ncbi:WD40-repeat-containing domain protein [Infundibulicybe gibba]|nr:WD40-repeat-containing domain protein [Infundibulicybe gibba]
MPPLKYKKKFDLKTSGPPLAIAFSDDGKLLASGSGRLVQLWATEGGVVRHDFVGKWGKQRTLYCGFESGYLVMIVVDEEKKELRTTGFQASQESIHHLAIHPSGSKLVIATKIERFDLALHPGYSSPLFLPQWAFTDYLSVPSISGQLQAWPVMITFMAWTDSISVKTLMVSYRHHGAIIWDVEQQEQLSAVTARDGVQSGGSLSPDGAYLAIPNSQQAFDLYQVQTGVHFKSFTDKDTQLGAPQTHPILFIHGGQWLLGGGIGKAVIWHVESGIQGQSLITGDGIGVRLLAANYDRSSQGDRFQIATTTDGPSIVLWRGHAIRVSPSF